MWRMWMHSGSTCGERDLIRRVRETPPGGSGISICQIRMVMNCHSRVQFSSLSTTARTHPDSGAVCEDTCATSLGAGLVRDGVPEMKQHSGHVPRSRTILLNLASSFGPC